MEFFVSLVFLCIILYVLFVKGVIWKLLVAGFAFTGMYAYLMQSVPSSKQICFTLGTTPFSYAAVVPAFVILMASYYGRN